MANDSPFLLDAWYAFGWSTEIDDRPIGRTIVGRPIVCFRAADGVAALEDTCPHRFLPLSEGSVCDGLLECAYHGLRFGKDGTCIANPLGAPPERAQARTFPVIEKHGVVWVWPGDPEAAAEELLADFSFLRAPDRAVVTGYSRVEADYQLAVDNLMDLTHVQYVHRDTRASEAYSRLEHDTRQDGEAVHRSITFPNGRPMPFYAKVMDPDALVDVTMATRWTPPSNVKLTVTVSEPDDNHAYIMGNDSAHLVTPEDVGSCHYLYAHCRDYRIDDPATDERIREWQRIGFGEQDKPILEAQQRRVANRDLMALHPVILPTDAGGVRARRILAQKIAREKEGRPR